MQVQFQGRELSSCFRTASFCLSKEKTSTRSPSEVRAIVSPNPRPTALSMGQPEYTWGLGCPRAFQDTRNRGTLSSTHREVTVPTPSSGGAAPCVLAGQSLWAPVATMILPTGDSYGQENSCPLTIDVVPASVRYRGHRRRRGVGEEGESGPR